MTDGNELELADGGHPGTSTGSRGGCGGCGGCEGRGGRNAGGGKGKGGMRSAQVTRGGGRGSCGGGGRSGHGMEIEVSTASAFTILLTTHYFQHDSMIV